MPNILIQLYPGENQDFATGLTGNGFDCVVLGASGRRFMTKPQLLAQYLNGALRLMIARRKLRDAGTVIVSGHFGYAVKLLGRLGFLKYRRLLCFAFFVHSPRWFEIVRWLSRLDRANDHYVIFSRSEVELYARRLEIERSRMHYLPYGEWAKIDTLTEVASEPSGGSYYFSGGYSNRDYRTLVEVFRNISARLVIICSRLNHDLDDVVLPPNVTVLHDLPRAQFEAYARGATAGIIALKEDTGASGQSVLLILMRLGKCIISNDAGAVRDYIEAGVSGLLLHNLAAELSDVIASLEHDHARAQNLGRAARERYESHYSPEAVSRAFLELLNAA